MELANNIYMNDELRAISEQVIAFCAKEVRPHGNAWEDAGEVPRDVLQKMGELGMFSLRIPESLGGLERGPIASCVFAEALACSSTFGGFDATVTVHTDMASPHLLNKGSAEQLERYVPGIISGETLTAIAVTEPGSGSDVAGMRSKAVRDGNGWRLNGSKMFITNGGTADLIIVSARTDPDKRYGISTFLLDKGTAGFSVSRKLLKHGWLCSNTAELAFDDVYLPADALLGEEHKGFYEIMKNFQNERLVLTASALGAAQTAIDMTLEHTQQRQAFGGVLYDKGAIRQRMAMNQAKLDAARAALYHAAWLYENGTDATKQVSAVKAFGCEIVNEIMYDCVQFHGGMGYMRETAVERMCRDARINTIGGGATEVMLEEVAKRSYLE